MSERATEPELRQLLTEQQLYYRQMAPSYGDTARVAWNEAEASGLDRELATALDRHFRGRVLELACGPGTWTRMLADRATIVTAVDGAPEMLAVAAESRPGYNVQFVQADIFEWQPERRYDGVFFGFWLSHVPDERFEPFWDKLAGCLAPGGHVAFVDDDYRTPDELIHGPDSYVIQRRLGDGSRHRIVKVTHTLDDLQWRLNALGWRFDLRRAGPFFWGLGAYG